MRCPYCVTEISDQALVCPQCTRELYLFKPLLAKIEQLEQAIGEQAKSAVADAEARIAALEAQMAALKPLTEGGMQVELVEKTEPAASAADADGGSEADSRAQGYAMGLLQTFLPSFLLLVAAHGVLLFVYDLKPLYLRIATILIPVPFGVLLAIYYRGRFWKSVGVAFVTAVLAVWAMLFVTATIDKVPVLPQDARFDRTRLHHRRHAGRVPARIPREGLEAAPGVPAGRACGHPGRGGHARHREGRQEDRQDDQGGHPCGDGSRLGLRGDQGLPGLDGLRPGLAAPG